MLSVEYLGAQLSFSPALPPSAYTTHVGISIAESGSVVCLRDFVRPGSRGLACTMNLTLWNLTNSIVRWLDGARLVAIGNIDLYWMLLGSVDYPLSY
jgi:hypothetical protein